MAAPCGRPQPTPAGGMTWRRISVVPIRGDLSACGRNDHHIAEAAFKAYGITLRGAVLLDPRRQGVPSTKGTL